MKDVMLDFETLGNGKHSCICQVGAVYFDRNTGELGKELKINVDAESHAARGGEFDASTVYWWLAQSDAARASILAEPRLSIFSAMVDLNEYLREAKYIWSHATFDFVILTETLKQLGIKKSFSYKAGLDIRTLMALAGTAASGFDREGTHHDALADAKFQVKYCVAAMKALGG